MSWKASTTTSDLEEWAKNVHIRLNFIGHRDELNGHGKPGSYIINLQDSKDGFGTHWTAFYLSPNHHAFYFDPFGVSSPEEVLSMMKKWTKNVGNIYINPFDIQSIKQGFCGEYCIDFLAHISRAPSLNGFKHFLSRYELFRIQKNKTNYI